jgi:hypothetical protein
MASNKGWWACDLDGTLAEYHGWPADGSIGKPIPAMVERVKGWLAEGKDVRIFTARIWPLGTTADADQMRSAQAIEQMVKITEWCAKHLGQPLQITCCKDYGMITLYDDRCVQVVPNTGELVTAVQPPDLVMAQ